MPDPRLPKADVKPNLATEEEAMYDVNKIIVIKQVWGNNLSGGGTDYWITFRTPRDLLGPETFIVGRVTDDEKIAEENFRTKVPSVVISHLEYSLAEALDRWEAEWDNLMHGVIDTDEARVSYGVLAWLPPGYTKTLFTPAIGGGVDRWLIAWSRKEMEELKKQSFEHRSSTSTSTTHATSTTTHRGGGTRPRSREEGSRPRDESGDSTFAVAGAAVGGASGGVEGAIVGGIVGSLLD